MDYRLAVEAAQDLARRAGALLRDHLSEQRRVTQKTSTIDLVSDMDRRVEAFIVEGLGQSFPTHGVRGEEGAGRPVSDPTAPVRHLWHIDPLDGTSNYLHRYPWFAVSLGLEELSTRGSRLVAGVVYHVMQDELFSATAGGGAFLNGDPIHVSDVTRLDASLLATGFPYWIGEETGNIVSNLERLLTKAQGVRRAGSAALDLACVACGRLDGYWEESLQTWDAAAGVLLVREAGGRVTDYDGRDVTLPTAHLVSSNAHIHDVMVAQVAGRYSPLSMAR